MITIRDDLIFQRRKISKTPPISRREIKEFVKRNSHGFPYSKGGEEESCIYKGVANKEKSKKLRVQLIKGFETRVSNKFCPCILNDVPQLDEYLDRVNRILDLGTTFIKDAAHATSLPAY